jgi:hypothetical protein
MAAFLRCLIGAGCGAVAGYLAFFWMIGQGFYALVLPGALLGIGCGALSTRRSIPWGIVCGVAGLALGIVLEWRFRPFADDRTFCYFLAHIHLCTPFTLISIAAGAVIAFWFGQGREGGVWKRHGRDE